jgi:superfamily I DNA/RNA helicase
LAISFKVDASKNLKERVQRRCGMELAARFDSHTFHAFAKRIIDRFRPVLQGNDALNVDYKIGSPRMPSKQIEFGDLIPLATQILKASSIARNAVRRSYDYVFLDEFQDCTDKQYELVKVAFMGTSMLLTAVGDIKQKIMGWAGALDGIFEAFANDFKAKSLNLYLNFRSMPRLLQMQNEIIRKLDPLAVMPDEQITGDGGEIFVHSFQNQSLEANFLADQIEVWLDEEKIELSEIAILVSKQTNLYANSLMEVLSDRGIPFRNEQEMQDLSTEPVARLIIDFLLCLYCSREPKAWLRLMEQLTPFSDDDKQSNSREEIHDFLKLVRKKVAATKAPDDKFFNWYGYVKDFFDKIGIETLSALSPDYESHTRLKEVIIETKMRIEEFIGLDLTLPEALERFYEEQAIRILTIHKSKGLEFDSVIIMAIENEIFFGDQSANRCAFFVGVSRAKRRLLLTHTSERTRPPGHRSRWDVHRTPQLEYLGYAEPFKAKSP